MSVPKSVDGDTREHVQVPFPVPVHKFQPFTADNFQGETFVGGEKDAGFAFVQAHGTPVGKTS
jgi:hypothetical protein